MTDTSTQRAGAPAFDVTSLARRFGDRVAVDDVSFTVAPGETFALLGPNGGGKTTLFRILATLIPPSSGDAKIFGRSVTLEADEVRRSIGVVFQKPSLDSRLTVRENLIHHGRLHGMSGRRLKDRAAEMMRLLGVADRARDIVSTLSGGLARRVELAKGLLHAPRALLLDEPNTGLDPAARRDFMDLLARLARESGVTVLLTTHFLEEADRSDRVGIMDRGRLVAVGEPDDLRRRIGGDVVTLETPEAAALSKRISETFRLPAVVVNGSVRVEAPRGHEFLRDAVESLGDSIRSASFGRPNLEDVFVHLTGRRLSEEGAPIETPAGGRAGSRA